MFWDLTVVVLLGAFGYTVSSQYRQTQNLLALRKEVQILHQQVVASDTRVANLGDLLVKYRNALSESLIRQRKTKTSVNHLARQQADFFGQLEVFQVEEAETRDPVALEVNGVSVGDDICRCHSAQETHPPAPPVSPAHQSNLSPPPQILHYNKDSSEITNIFNGSA